MIKIAKNLTVLAMSVALLLCTTACGDKSWAIKSDAGEVSSSAYVYFLMMAYNEASDKLFERGISAADIRNETIDDKNAADWIRERAIYFGKDMLATDKMFGEMSLTLTDDEMKKAQEITDSLWENSGEVYEKRFGINKDTVHQVYSLLSAKQEKIFDAIYGKNGSSAVSDDDLTGYYNSNYIALRCYSKAPFDEAEGAGTTESADGNTENNGENKGQVDTDEVINKQYAGYVEAINSGAKTIDQIAQTIKETDKLDGDANPLELQLANPSSPEFPQEIADVVRPLEVGKAAFVKYNDMYFFFYRDQNAAVAQSLDLSKDENRKRILTEMKADEFKAKVAEVAAGMRVELNRDAIDQYDPAMFAS